MLLSKRDNHPDYVKNLVSEWFDSFGKKYGFQRDYCDIKQITPGRYFATLKNGPETLAQVMLPGGHLVDTGMSTGEDKCLLSIYKKPRSIYYSVVLSQTDLEHDKSRCRLINKKMKSKRQDKILEGMVQDLPETIEKENIDPKAKINELEKKIKELRE